MRLKVFAFLLVLLTACGEEPFVQRVATNDSVFDEVRIVRLTPAVIAVANQDRFEPIDLPGAFSPQKEVALDAPAGMHPTSWPTKTSATLYRIGPGDVLAVSTVSRFGSGSVGTEMANGVAEVSVQVDSSGTIALSELGEVSVGDMTLSEARRVLVERYRKAQIDPRFELAIQEFNARKATVSGAVNQPAVIKIGLAPVSFSEALALAGDVSSEDVAGVRVRLLRDNRIYEADLSDFLQKSELRNTHLQDGDQLIVVDQRGGDAKRKAEALGREVDGDRRNRFVESQEQGAVPQHFVYIAGEVNQQGRFTLPYGRKAVLADALFDAQGGLSRLTANPTEIYIVRIRNRRATVYQLSAANAVDLALAADVELRPKDIVFVSERPIAAWNRIITGILPRQFVSVSTAY